jgi:elongation factor P
VIKYDKGIAQIFLIKEKYMISAGDFRKGITFEINGEPYVIIDFQHVKPGKGAAFVRTKYKNILTGATREEAFNPNDKFENAHIETKQMQYLYEDGGLYYFMDQNTYEQAPLTQDQVEDAMHWLRENDVATIKFFKDKAFLVEAPFIVELTIIETEPGVKGDTATNVTKAAKVETGATVQVPIFIEEGEVIKIDTRIGEYLGRA